ncbi:hypothetical protein F5Y16DRAFT_401443 [Xylariaceae sp. FL0255]|nr:hypothetical protein F5Y16DRAFT_401443 [Xylariaceae sp. FL0255]
MSTDEEQPFLTAESADNEKASSNWDPISTRLHYSKVHKFLWVLHFIFLAFNVAFLVSLIRANGLHRELDVVAMSGTFPPVVDEVEYVIQNVNDGPNAFTGRPRPELDEAWSSLLRSTTIRVSEAELQSVNESSIPLLDGSGYVGYLEVHHLLHCVKRIYQMEYPEYYSELFQSGSLSMHHKFHCLESLRQGLMCNADLKLNTYRYETPEQVRGDRSGTRKCTNWDRIQAWADAEERDLQIGGDGFIYMLTPFEDM